MKNFFKYKFLITALVLVITIFITSSCYASFSNSTVDTFPFSKEALLSDSRLVSFCNNNNIDLSNSLVVSFHTLNPPFNQQAYWVMFVYNNYENVSYMKFDSSLSQKYTRFYNSNDVEVKVDYVYGYVSSSGAFNNGQIYNSTNDLCRFTSNSSNYNIRLCDLTDFDFYYDSNLIHSAPLPAVTFDYSFTGIDYHSIRLDISNLDSSYRMYGYYNIDNSFEVGDTFNSSTFSNHLRLISGRSDNSDLWCNINLGEVITYFVVDSNNTILKIGDFNQMAVGDFLYGFNVKNRDAVDFVFVRNGSVYWNNDLNFYYKDSHGVNFINDNNIVSSNSYSLIYNSSFYNSGTYSAKVCDSNENILSSFDLVYQNDWSSDISLSITSSYYENHVGWNKSCFWIQSFALDGKDISGSSIDFTGYKVRWSIPTSVVVDSLEVGYNSYSKRSGTFTCSSSNGLLSMINIQVYVLIRDYVPFDFTFEVFDSNDNLVLTQKLNSDSIVSNKISSQENEVSQPDYEIVNNPNYSGSNNTTSSNNSFDYNSISDWSVDDYANLMNTNNTIWQFFKAILGNLPWWITTPIFILILGVVIISLIRFARGA